MKIVRICLSVVLMLAVLCIGVPVTAEDVSVTSIVADDLSVYLESDGYWCGSYDENGNYFGYDRFEYELEPICTVNYSDGSSITVEFYELHSLLGRYPKVITDQSADNEWGLGEHTASFICGDFAGEFTVTVLPSPVVSITVQDPVIRQYIDGTYGMDDQFIYTFDPILTVTFNDGTVITGTRNEIQMHSGYPVYWDSDQLTPDEWDVGDHNASAFFMGTQTDFTVTVIDVVTGVEMITPPIDTTLLYGAYVDMSGSVLRVHFADGTTEDVPLDNQHTNVHYTVDTLQESCLLERTPSRVLESGQQDITIRFLGETLTFTVDVSAPPTALQLTGNTDHTLSLIFDCGDTTQTVRVLAFTSSGGMSDSDGTIRANGTLYTDGGMFMATLIKDGVADTVSVELGNQYDGGVFAVSNTITDTTWFDRHNGIAVRGDYNNDGIADTTDARMILRDLNNGFIDTLIHGYIDMNDDGTIGTADVRLLLQYVLG